MNLTEALANVDKLCGVTAPDLKSQMHRICQQVLGKMEARGLIHSNVTIVTIKDALNEVINEKAKQLIEQYARILRSTEITDFKTLGDQLLVHAKGHLDQHYSEGCHQLADNEQRILAGATPLGIHLKGDYQKMLMWVEPQIRILVAELEKSVAHRSPPATAQTSIAGGLIPMTFSCNSANARVRNLCDELKGLSPAIFPNACAFTLRSFIEISAYCFLEMKGEVKKMHGEYLADIAAKNAGRPPERCIKPIADWTPDLSAMMKRLSTAGNGLLKSHTSKALSKVINEEEALFGLNLSTHNPAYHPDEKRLRHTWQNLEEYFREILA